MTDKLKTELNNSLGRKLLVSFLSDSGIAPQAMDKFDALTELYLQVNSSINISAIKSIDDIYIKHYLDSVYPYKYFAGTVCDVGCGGGFPTLPLAIVTDLDITGLDSVGKKLTLIKRCAAELGINAKTEYMRSEDLAKRGQAFDTVCARALADIDKAISYCAPLAKADGTVILYRTQNDEQAKPSTLTKYHLTPLIVEDYIIPGTDIKRRLFIYKKSM